MSKKYTYAIVSGVVVLLVIAAIFSISNMKTKYNTVEDITDVKMEAQRLYSEGKIDEAISRLDTYCYYAVIDVDAKAMLGDWYLEAGDEDRAYECYLMAASNKKNEGELLRSLSIKNTEEVVLVPANSYSFEITPDVRLTKDMTLTVTGQNLMPRNIAQGRVNKNDYQLADESEYVTTDWFDINPEGSYLTLSGGFNCAIWQFANDTGEIIAYAESPNTYRRNESIGVDIYQMARAIIPEKAAKCRVTYYNTLLEEVTASPDETVTIVYGRLPGESKAPESVTYKIPDLKEGEKVVYNNGVWTLVTKMGETVIDGWVTPSVELGSHISIGGTVPGRVSFEKSPFISYEKEKIYTIQFDLNNPSNTGKRLDDAKNMAFNGAVGEGFLSQGENTFDNAYPWSEMKLCAIKNGTIVYKGEEGFSDTGEAGDVFVEIPKFYSKRVVDGQYETISISGYPHEGFEVDEAFLTENGEKEAIYIAAYTSSLDDDGNIQSVSRTAPVVYLAPTDMTKMIESKGKGYKAMDYAALSMLQKLFLVETGVRNSQCLYMGVCGLSIASASGADGGYSVAKRSREKTSCIDVSDVYSYNEGESIVLYNTSDYSQSYSEAILNPRQITAVVKNADSTVSVFFSGESVTVTENDTAIAHIAKNNGTTDSISYHTGSAQTARGTLAFKYRHIENIWGNTHTYVDNVRVKNGQATLTDRKGNNHTLSYALPSKNYEAYMDVMIKQMGYDPSYSGVMLPMVIGEGATSSTYYGDTYMHNHNSEEEYTLYYGGGWSSAESAGLFSYVALTTKDEGSMNASCRMMYIE